MKPVLSSQSAHSVFCTQSTFCTLFSPDLIPSGWLGSKHQLTTTTLCFLYAVHILYTLLPVRNLHSVPSVSCTLSTFHIVCTLFLSLATAHYTVSSNPNSAHSLSCTQSTFRTLCFLYAVHISHCVHSFPESRHCTLHCFQQSKFCTLSFLYTVHIPYALFPVRCLHFTLCALFS